MESIFKKEYLKDVKRSELVPILRKLGEYTDYYLRPTGTQQFSKVKAEAYEDAMTKYLEAASNLNVKSSEMFPLMEYMLKVYDEEQVQNRAKSLADQKIKEKEEELGTMKKEMKKVREEIEDMKYYRKK